MSVQWTVARAVSLGLLKDHLPFVRTSKGGMRRSTDFHAFWEAVLAGLLILGAVVLVMTNYKEIREINIFAVVLVVQSLPFIAAVGLALIERTRLNDFAYWRSLEARVTAALPIARRSATMAEATRTAPAPKPGELVQ
jgi:drug/metabolite transporter (DMT)-like permease